MSDPYPYVIGHHAAPPPLRRPHAVQPPSLLITSLDNARGANAGHAAATGIAQTPASTTSLSTPFSAHPQSAYPQTPGGAMRGLQSQSLRSQNSFSGTYNPQQWGPMSATSPQAGSSTHRQYRTTTLAPQPVGPDEGIASPPPPYSPRREPGSQDSPRNATNTTSLSSTTSPSTDSPHHVTPVSASAAISPDLYSAHARNHTLASQSQSSDSASPNYAFPPPPPAAGLTKSRSRANSRMGPNALLSSIRSKASASSNTPEAVNVLLEDRIHTLSISTQNIGAGSVLQPPAARRAASTGGIGVGANSSRSPIYTESPNAWDGGTAVPPPPPGPPPSAARAQSLNRYAESPSSTLAPSLPLRHRGPPGRGTTLDTVPPTPADWREEAPQASYDDSRSKPAAPLHIDTGSIIHRRRPETEEPITVTGTTPSHARRDSSANALFRSPAVRNRSAKGIRERRSESRNGKGRTFEDSAVDLSDEVVPWDEDTGAVRPANLMLGRGQSKSKRTYSKLSPRSGKSMQSIDGAVRDPNQHISSANGSPFESPNATPPATPGRLLKATSNLAGVSTASDTNSETRSPAGINSSEPKSSFPSSFSSKSPKARNLHLRIDSGTRPISHLLHMPVAEECSQVALTPSSKTKERPVSDLLGPESPTAFAARANERHRNFAAKEAAARTDSERLDIFVQFMLSESRIRREQYGAVSEEENARIDDILRETFKSPSSKETFHDAPTDPSLRDGSTRTSLSSSALGEESPFDEDSSARTHESPSSATTNGSMNRPGSGWMKDYVPCLSPIASMSIVTGQDEVESRGRAPSRWWEGSGSGDAGPSDGFKVLARSKRESKYMGLPKEARDSLALDEQRVATPTNAALGTHSSSKSLHQYGPNEYPPEKVGWHDEELHTSVPTPSSHMPPTPASAAYTPNPRQLDVSRLVTLPPPYPRHHPALNNSHPDLAGIRAVVRSLQEKEEPNTVRDVYHTQIKHKRQRAGSWQEHQRSLHQQDIEFRISHGELSSDEYEEAEAAFQQRLWSSEKETVQADFDLFQDKVVTPLHALYTDRVNLATEYLDRLSSRVFSDAQSHSPNMPQEEGDERPELLEMLTMLKWLFDAREACHRHLYDLLTDRNAKYQSVVTLPYTQQSQSTKIHDANTFFAQDAADRKRTFDVEVSGRATAFLTVVEANVSRGVEIQLDAFWSIAPQLKELLHKVPTSSQPPSRSVFDIAIPAEEYDENPSYHSHPLQYLYSLLSHAEKSSYQFIESQINLLCLLHEIRNAVLLARLRTERSEREADDARNGANGNGIGRHWEEWQQREQIREESSMTADLKEKVGVVEGQWSEALGEEIMEVRERVRGWLLEEGGWDEEVFADV